MMENEKMDFSGENNFPGKPELGDSLDWKNSANVLCNYMKKQEYLDLILKNQAIIPRYYEEPLGYLRLENIDKVCFPMTCFCDIPFSKVSSHMYYYGSYGIGLDKTAVLRKYRVQPIHYINTDSPLADDFRQAFHISRSLRPDGEAAVLADYLLSSLMYMKPVWGWEESAEGGMEKRVYQDECEWRYVPSDHFPENLHLILRQWEMTDKGKETYTKVLYHHEECWLKFDWSDVYYIIVPDEFAARHTISTVRSLENVSNDVKDELISRIEISSRFAKNM